MARTPPQLEERPVEVRIRLVGSSGRKANLLQSQYGMGILGTEHFAQGIYGNEMTPKPSLNLPPDRT